MAAWTNLFVLLEKQGECLLVKRLVESFRISHLSFAGLHTQIAICYNQLDDVSLAEWHFFKAAQLESSNIHMWRNLGTFQNVSVVV